MNKLINCKQNIKTFIFKRTKLNLKLNPKNYKKTKDTIFTNLK